MQDKTLLYPDFLIQVDECKYLIVEVKGDNMIDDPVVQAKKEFAEQMGYIQRDEL